jgi:hypothetical protein
MQANIYVCYTVLGLYFCSTYILTINAPLILILREAIYYAGKHKIVCYAFCQHTENIITNYLGHMDAPVHKNTNVR